MLRKFRSSVLQVLPVLLLSTAFFIALPVDLQARCKFMGWAQDGGQTVTTAGVISTTKVQRSYPNASVTVYARGTLTLATIYSNSGGTVKANPFAANSSGKWEFYGDNSSYDVQFSGGSPPNTIPIPFTLSDVGCQAVFTSPVFSIVDFGATPDDAVNDATAIDAAWAAAIAASGGVVYVPKGLFRYSGTGLDVNPAVGVTIPIALRGEGPNTSEIFFIGCSNPQCIRISTQDAVGSNSSFGSSITGMTISTGGPALTKNVVVIQNREQTTLRDLYIYGGTNGLTVNESRNCIISSIQLINWSVNGVNVIGDTHSGDFYDTLNILGASSATGAGFNYEKTGATDTGGIYIRSVRIHGNSAYGLRFHNATTPRSSMFVFASDVTAQGAFTSAAWSFKNMRVANLMDVDGLASGTGSYVYIFDNCEEIGASNLKAYAQAPGLGNLLFLNSNNAFNFEGVQVTSTLTAYVAGDSTTHTQMNLRGQTAVSTTTSNDLSKFQTVTEARSRAYNSGGQSINSSTWTKLTFDTNVYDYGPVHSTTTNPTRFTAQALGEYQIGVVVTFASNATNNRYVRAIKNNTTVLGAVNNGAVSGDASQLNLSLQVTLAKNDYIEFEAFQNSGGALNTVAGLDQTAGWFACLKCW